MKPLKPFKPKYTTADKNNQLSNKPSDKLKTPFEYSQPLRGSISSDNSIAFDETTLQRAMEALSRQRAEAADLNAYETFRNAFPPNTLVVSPGLAEQAMEISNNVLVNPTIVVDDASCDCEEDDECENCV